MPAEIWSADIVLKFEFHTRIFNQVPVKKLPIHILLSNSEFVDRLKRYCGGEIAWNKLNPSQKMPNVTIVYHKLINTTNT